MFLAVSPFLGGMSNVQSQGLYSHRADDRCGHPRSPGGHRHPQLHQHAEPGHGGQDQGRLPHRAAGRRGLRRQKRRSLPREGGLFPVFAAR